MRTHFVLLTTAAFIAFASPALANERAWGEGVQVMSDQEMSGNRGGFQIAGLNINFGAVVTTYVNGTPALSTTLTWTDVGAFVDQTVGQIGTNISDMSPDELAALGLEGLQGTDGVVIEDEAGVTALVHNITEGSLQNIIINNATGRDLTQEIDVTLELPGFDVMQGALLVETFGIRLNDDLSGFLVGGFD